MKSINNLYLSASLLLMKNIFKDIKELKPVLKKMVMLDDDRVIRLFEYIVVNKDIEKEELKELIIEMKGENTMPTLAQRWLDEGKVEGIQIGIQTGMFETAIKMIEKFNLSVDDVIKELNLKKEELLEYMQKKNSGR